MEAHEGAGAGAGDSDGFLSGVGVHATHGLEVVVDAGAVDEGEDLSGSGFEVLLREAEGEDGLADAEGVGGGDGKRREPGLVGRREVDSKHGEVEGFVDDDRRGEIAASGVALTDDNPGVAQDGLEAG